VNMKKSRLARFYGNMPSACRSPRALLPAIFATLALIAAAASPAFAADLQDDTLKAFARYIEAAQARMAREEDTHGTFLHIETLPAAAQRQIRATLKRGDVWTYPLEATDESGQEIRPPHATITHWAGDIFIPGRSVDQVLAVLLDFNHLNEIYKPEVVQSRLLERDGETYKAFVRLHKDTPWVNPTLNINWTATVTHHDPDRAACQLISTRIAQVEDAGRPGEHEDSVGHDGGYMWRMNTYWRLEERDGGVVGEWEAITLSRDIPFLLRWIVRPFVDRLARQTIRATLIATRDEAEKRARSSAESHGASSGTTSRRLPRSAGSRKSQSVGLGLWPGSGNQQRVKQQVQRVEDAMVPALDEVVRSPQRLKLLRSVSLHSGACRFPSTASEQVHDAIPRRGYHAV
jgi:hypothetical protein